MTFRRQAGSDLYMRYATPSSLKLPSAQAIRAMLSFLTVSIFLVILLFSGLTIHPIRTVLRSGHDDTPDFSRYKLTQTLSERQFPLDNKRLIIVGDIHGMNKPFHSLLDKVSYNAKSDVLIHVGDIVAKGTHEGSMAVLSYMSSHNVTGVRGNHDQKVIEWRSWIEWIHGMHKGKEWLHDLQEEWENAESKGMDLDLWVEQKMRLSDDKWWTKVPEGWKILSDHYQIARKMSRKEFEYFLSRPVVLHAPSAHTFIVHAGLLASDPRLDPNDLRQPLSHVPPLSHGRKDDQETIDLLRRLQEESLLTDVPTNGNPWLVQNMRSVKHQEATRKKKGTPWSELWNHDMSLCSGFNTPRHPHGKPKSLPCYPSTVLYGHAATRGLDIKRWSIGIDSGCVYGNQLTALVVDPKQKRASINRLADLEDVYVDDDEEVDDARHTLPYGDKGRARIVNVECS